MTMTPELARNALAAILELKQARLRAENLAAAIDNAQKPGTQIDMPTEDEMIAAVQQYQKALDDMVLVEAAIMEVAL